METETGFRAFKEMFWDAATTSIYIIGLIFTEIVLRPYFGGVGIPLLAQVILFLMESTLLVQVGTKFIGMITLLVKAFFELATVLEVNLTKKPKKSVTTAHKQEPQAKTIRAIIEQRFEENVDENMEIEKVRQAKRRR